MKEHVETIYMLDDLLMVDVAQETPTGEPLPDYFCTAMDYQPNRGVGYWDLYQPSRIDDKQERLVAKAEMYDRLIRDWQDMAEDKAKGG